MIDIYVSFSLSLVTLSYGYCYIYIIYLPLLSIIIIYYLFKSNCFAMTFFTAYFILLCIWFKQLWYWIIHPILTIIQLFIFSIHTACLYVTLSCNPFCTDLLLFIKISFVIYPIKWFNSWKWNKWHNYKHNGLYNILKWYIFNGPVHVKW